MIGIDSQVQARMDQFRGRPQDLMQQYQMSRELIDLLALQKLKSEKDSAARSMMMQMQQNPQTIAAQREAELMGRTQQEVAQQVGGIAQLAEARKQQNLQRMASGAQPPVKMAEGGDVDLDRLVKEASEKYGQLPPELLRAVIAQESSGNPRATSEAGARGLMQLMPATAGDLGVTNPDDLYDPAINIDAGARYLNQLMQQFGGDTTAALSAYHSGPGRVSRLREEYGDDYVDQLGPIGQRYAADVLNRIELSPGAQEQLAASVTRMPPPTVITTVMPEPPRDTGRRQTDAPAVGGLDSLREALAGSEQRRVDPALERQVATRMEPSVGDIRAAKDYLARVPDAVADLFSGKADMVPPSVKPVVDYLARVPGAVADLFVSDEQPAPQAEPPAEPPPEQYTGIGFGSPAAAASRTPADLRAEEEARVREALGQEGIMSAYKDMIRRQQELSGRLQDPEQQRRERYLAALRGIARAGGIGYGGGSQAAEAVRRRQNALAQELLDKEFGITREQLGAQLGIGKEALAGGRSVFEQSSEDIRSAATRAARSAADNAKLRLDMLKSEREGRIAARELLQEDPVYLALIQELNALRAEDEDTSDAEVKIQQFVRRFEDEILRGPVVGIRQKAS